MYRYLLSLATLSMLVVTATATCSHEETNKASQEFKDCVDRKELQLIRMERSREDKQTFICDKLEEISSDCHRALAKCRTREYVDDKVAIHINSISGNNNLLCSTSLSLSVQHTNYPPRSLAAGQRETQGTTDFLKDTPGNISHSGSL